MLRGAGSKQSRIEEVAPLALAFGMANEIIATLLALQSDGAAYQNSAPVLSVLLMATVIGIIMVALLIIGVLSFSERVERGPKTRA